MGKSVRNDVHAEARAVDLVNGERDAVERDRPFCGDEARERRGSLQHKPDAVAVLIAREDPGAPVDMAGDEMAAELVAERQRPLQIDAAPRLPGAERGAREGLVGDLDGEDGALALRPCSPRRW